MRTTLYFIMWYIPIASRWRWVSKLYRKAYLQVIPRVVEGVSPERPNNDLEENFVSLDW